MRYEWDKAKNRSNFAKHGFNFEDADRCFSDHVSRSRMTALIKGKNGSSH
jgi:uncharacterized DUF497 family protein